MLPVDLSIRYSFLTVSRTSRQLKHFTLRSIEGLLALENHSTLATVSCNVFLQAGDGHRHFVRQAPFLLPRELALSRVSRLAAVSEKAAHAITGFLELTFEPSMLGTRYRQGREGTHEAPVENIEEESSRKANKRQILFSPTVRSRTIIATLADDSSLEGASA